MTRDPSRALRVCGRVGICAVLAFFLLSLQPGAAAIAVRHQLEPGMYAVLTDASDIYLEALPLREEGLLAFARRLCGDSRQASVIREHNGSGKHLLAGVRYKVPLELLRDDLRERVLLALFPGDEVRASGWAHQVRAGQQESLWQIAEWFTGHGEYYRQIRDANGLADEEIKPGQVLLVPAALLRNPFRGVVARLAPQPPAAPPSPPAPEPAASELAYGQDRAGEFAVYRLKAGEALYSSVVVRFTGRLFAEDVNALALEIAARSGIADVTDIPVGYPVKIPLDNLSPQFLPTEHPGRREYDENRSASAQFSNRVRTSDLSGVTIIIDAGHGGRDVGASRGAVWESVYVYDIMQRTRRVLEARTGARVLQTTRDSGRRGLEDRDVLGFSRQHAVLTDPPYTIEDAKVGTNLRWYLANSIYREVRTEGRDTHEVIFLSIHADSLHPSLRGTMVYVPGLLPTRDDYGKTGTVYTSRREVREHPRVSFSRQDRVRSEGLSRELAGHLIASFERRRLAIHPNQPVRDKIVRARGEAWVPAVLRYNAVPAKVLVEICNLANQQDLKLIQTRAFRQEVAEALVDGILAYYGETAAPVQLTSTAGD